jgi:predicted GTPase
MADLGATIDATDCDLVLVATPIDLARVVSIRKPCQRVTYELVEEGDGLARAVRGAVELNPARE